MINIQEGGWGLQGGWSPLFLLALFCLSVQFQKQGKDTEKVKQRLAEIANYVDKVTIKSSQCTKHDLFEVTSSLWRINRPASAGLIGL